MSMRGVQRQTLLSLVTLGLAMAPAGTLALRCSGGLVSPGDHKVEVLAACGKPLFREQVVEYPFRVGEFVGVPHREYLPLGVVTEEWVYEFGPQRFRQLLRFRNNRVTSIEILSKPR